MASLEAGRSHGRDTEWGSLRAAVIVPDQAFSLCLACLPPGGGGACLFQNGGCLLLMGTPPLGGWGVGQEWVGGLQGKGYTPLHFPSCW